MRFSIIVAAGENQVIGADNDLPWRISSDLRRFRILTMGKPIVMGRKTFLSLGRPLDGRDNIVITRDKGFEQEGVFIAYSIEEALQLGEVKAIDRGVEEVMIIGGAEIYNAALPIASRIYYTLVHTAPDGDTYFPKLDESEWQKVSSEHFAAHENDTADYSLMMFERL